MKFYIGLGGIGCRVLRDYKNSYSECNEKAYFIDTASALKELYGALSYTIPGFEDGARTFQSIGRNAMYYELLTGKMAGFFADIREADSVELIFVLTSFGGFGSGAVFPLIDYLEALAWGRCKACTVVAFSEASFGWLIPKQYLKIYETNTIDFVREIEAREQSFVLTEKLQEKLFNPGCTTFLLDTQTLEFKSTDVYKTLSMSQDELTKLDCKHRYVSKQNYKHEMKPVFISYSFKNQDAADYIVCALEDAGIGTWIATKDIQPGSYAAQIVQAIREARVFLVLISKDSIQSEQVKNEIDRAFNRVKEGLEIIPFILDNSELDDECQYYLCRQKKIYGVLPPFNERVRELVNTIRDACE